LGLAAAPALGATPPKLYARLQGHDRNTVFTPVFVVRPAKVELQTPYGGTLTLRSMSMVKRQSRTIST
jgi:hypothetical protein